MTLSTLKRISPPRGKTQAPSPSKGDQKKSPGPGKPVTAADEPPGAEPLPFTPTLVSGPSGGVGLTGAKNSHSAVMARGFARAQDGGEKSSAEAVAGASVRQIALSRMSARSLCRTSILSLQV